MVLWYHVVPELLWCGPALSALPDVAPKYNDHKMHCFLKISLKTIKNCATLFIKEEKDECPEIIVFCNIYCFFIYNFEYIKNLYLKSNFENLHLRSYLYIQFSQGFS